MCAALQQFDVNNECMVKLFEKALTMLVEEHNSSGGGSGFPEGCLLEFKKVSNLELINDDISFSEDNFYWLEGDFKITYIDENNDMVDDNITVVVFTSNGDSKKLTVSYYSNDDNFKENTELVIGDF
jgi:hypothetical protein